MLFSTYIVILMFLPSRFFLLDFDDVTHIVLPGVGSFDWAMQCLTSSGLLHALNHAALVQSTPILGVCVGMQIMANRSDEGDLSGLGWIPGEVKRLDTTFLPSSTHLPHMGWNDATLPHTLCLKIF